MCVILVMQLYRAKTEEILRRFFDGQIDRWQCTNELNAAFTALLPRLTADNVDEARALTYSNEKAKEYEIRRRDGLSTRISNLVTTRLPHIDEAKHMRLPRGAAIC